MTKTQADKLIAALPDGVTAEIRYTHVSKYSDGKPRTQGVRLNSDGWETTVYGDEPDAYLNDRSFFGELPAGQWKGEDGQSFWQFRIANPWKLGHPSLTIDGEFKADGRAYFTVRARFKDWRKDWPVEHETLQAATGWVLDQMAIHADKANDQS